MFIVSIFSLFLGKYPGPGISLLTPMYIFQDQMAFRMIVELKVPRILTAILLGMTLAASGFVFQMLFGNPIVEAGFLGVSQGAAFGAALSIILFAPFFWLVQITSIFFALIGLFLSYFIARHIHFGGWIIRLVLSGIAVSALFTSGIGFLKYIADPLSEHQEISFWILGSLSNITWDRIIFIIPVSLICLLFIYLFRWRINVLSFDDKVSFSLGTSPVIERFFLLSAASASVAVLISVCGIIGWVGLIVPHIVRKLFGADSRYALPASMFAGAIFVLICDNIARISLTGEIPLGVITSFMGAILFVVLLSMRFINIKR